MSEQHIGTNRMGTRSALELNHVDSRLIVITTHAMLICPIDFAVHDGLRTEEEQRELYADGASWTLDSDHLVDDETMLGHAVDLVPFVGGRLTWKSEAAFGKIATAMRAAAAHHGWSELLGWGALRKFGGDWRKVNDMAHWYVKREWW